MHCSTSTRRLSFPFLSFPRLEKLDKMEFHPLEISLSFRIHLNFETCSRIKQPSKDSIPEIFQIFRREHRSSEAHLKPRKKKKKKKKPIIPLRRRNHFTKGGANKLSIGAASPLTLVPSGVVGRRGTWILFLKTPLTRMTVNRLKHRAAKRCGRARSCNHITRAKREREREERKPARTQWPLFL